MIIFYFFQPKRSQPSWAAWIEIILFMLSPLNNKVAALLGCVD